MDSKIDTVEYRGFDIDIHLDYDPENPREWDNLSKMFCFNRRYNLGDKNPYSSDEFEGWEDFKNRIIEDYNPLLIFPLSILDHSGVYLKIGTQWQSDYQGWDTSFVGFVFITKEDVKKEYGVKRITKKIRERAEKVLRAEVDTYASYVSGNVYGFDVEDVDSCWGYYDYDYMIDEAKRSIDSHIEWIIKNHTKKGKAYIRNHVPEIYREPCPCL